MKNAYTETRGDDLYEQTRDNGDLVGRSYPHMCRMDHLEIGYKVGPNIDEERCPLCQSMDRNDFLVRDNAKLSARVSELEAENQMLKVRLVNLSTEPNPPYHYA